MYALANLAKGGVIKVFNAEHRRQVSSDCGVAGRLADGRMVTSQWIDPRYRVSAGEDELTVTGSLQQMASMSSFTPAKMVAFRTVLTTLGRSSRASHAIKGAIRRMLMLGTKAVPLAFQRRVRFERGRRHHLRRDPPHRRCPRRRADGWRRDRRAVCAAIALLSTAGA